MSSNPTPDRYDEFVASCEDMADGLSQHEATIGIEQNTFAKFRADLDALLAAQAPFLAAETAQGTAYTALRSADSNGKGFIAKSIKLLAITLGTRWSDAWIATGLPDQSVSTPGSQDKRFTALAGLKAYFTANPTKESAALNITAAAATTLHTAISNARQAAGNALTFTKGKLIPRDNALRAMRRRFRATIDEIENLLPIDDPRWYDFGLNRPADPAQPGTPADVTGTALGSQRALVQYSGARRANSFNIYRQIVGADTTPVKVTNTEGTQYTLENLPVGATVKITVTGVNEAGEGPASDPVQVVVT